MLTRQSQTTFYILEEVVILHETIHEIQRKRQNGIIINLDFDRAYDKLDWSFLQQDLRMKGFSKGGVHGLTKLLHEVV
jgi:hypothetical protein